MKKELQDSISEDFDSDHPQKQVNESDGPDDTDDNITDDDFQDNLDDEPGIDQIDENEHNCDNVKQDQHSEIEDDFGDDESEAKEDFDQEDEDLSRHDNQGQEDLSKSDDTFEEDFEATFESVVEAVLFASDEPLSESRLSNIVEAGSVRQIRKAVEALNEHYSHSNRAFRVEKIAGGYQMMTLGPYNHWLRKMLRVKSDNRLSQAALETLAIIAYKQPIIRADVEAIRGVAAGEMIRSLMYKGLVKIVGRAEVLGRPMLYGTTKKFLDIFGLNSLEDLPKVEQLRKPEED